MKKPRKSKLWKVVGSGNYCPKCVDQRVSIKRNSETGRMIEVCKVCGRAWEVAEKFIPALNLRINS